MQTRVQQATAGSADAIDRDDGKPVVRSVTSAELLRGERLLVIHHGAAAYRLQITQGGKLILTK